METFSYGYYVYFRSDFARTDSDFVSFETNTPGDLLDICGDIVEGD